MVRFGAAELHVVAAPWEGWIAAQEAIKLLTCQFIPRKGTLIYDGISGTSLQVSLAGCNLAGRGIHAS
jgi:hypothetical protein